MRHGKRRRSAATNARVEADGSVDAQNAPTDPCKTTERFCTSSHTLHRRFPFQKNPRPEPLRISGQLPTDSAEEAFFPVGYQGALRQLDPPQPLDVILALKARYHEPQRVTLVRTYGLAVLAVRYKHVVQRFA